METQTSEHWRWWWFFTFESKPTLPNEEWIVNISQLLPPMSVVEVIELVLSVCVGLWDLHWAELSWLNRLTYMCLSFRAKKTFGQKGGVSTLGCFHFFNKRRPSSILHECDRKSHHEGLTFMCKTLTCENAGTTEPKDTLSWHIKDMV